MPGGYAAWKGVRGWSRLAKPWKHRVAMMKTMVTQLLEKERIKTTLAKARSLQQYTDGVITLGKKGTHEAWVKAHGIVRTDRELHKLFTAVALRYRDRPGGYTRLMRVGFREGDAAPMALLELVDREGELRPARTPRGASPLLPAAAAAYLRQQDEQASGGPPASQAAGLIRQMAALAPFRKDTQL